MLTREELSKLRKLLDFLVFGEKNRNHRTYGSLMVHKLSIAETEAIIAKLDAMLANPSKG